MKKVLVVILILAGLGLIAWTLAGNKKEMEEKVKLAQLVSDIIPVEISQVVAKNMEDSVAVVGTFEPYSDLSVLAQTEGIVTGMYHEKGDYVTKGTILAEVENATIKAELEAAKANLDKAKLDLERFGNLVDKAAVTERQFEDVRINAANAEATYKATQKRLEDSYIRAGVSGKINEDYIELGTNVTQNMKAFDLVNISRLRLNVKLTAGQVLGLREGDTVKVSADLYPGKFFEGKIQSIAAKADESLKYGVEIVFENSEADPIKAGMFGKAHFHFSQTVEATYVNRNALTGSIKDPKVYVVQDGLALLRDIQVGQVYESELEVLSGLKAGETVVVNGQINLTDSVKVRDINAVRPRSEAVQTAEKE